MEELTLATPRTPRPRPVTENFQASAWRAPASPRFDSRPANDFGNRVEPVETTEPVEPSVMPRWFITIAGGLIVAMLAVFAANAMAL